MRPLLMIAVLLFTRSATLQNPPCDQRPTWTDPPWIQGGDWCLEEVINDPEAGVLGFSALASAPDGTLYATRPLSGQILALDDSNGDDLPDRARVVAEGLTLPNGLDYYEGALYISGGAKLYRLEGEALTLLTDDLPAGSGFWTGGLTIGPDERIYVAIGAGCDLCEGDAPGRGAIWSYALDGSDPRQVASGLRQPGDVAFLDGALWTLDSAPAGAAGENLDELNRVEAGAFFGWPYCVGAGNQAALPSETVDCAEATAPAFNFPTHSRPLGLAAYESNTFPKIQGHLLVTLYGNSHDSWLEGYSAAAVHFNEAGQPDSYRVIIPENPSPTNSNGPDTQAIHYQGSGFWPQRPIDVTVSAEGWIYVSVTGGRIFALRSL